MIPNSKTINFVIPERINECFLLEIFQDLLFVVASICCLEPEKWFKIHVEDTFCIMALYMSFYAWVAQRRHSCEIS